VADEVQPVWVVENPLEGEQACDELRTHGIKCACVEMPNEAARASPLRFITAVGNTGMDWTVIVSPPDLERARSVLVDWDGPGSVYEES
jgi:hypothetical protein